MKSEISVLKSSLSGDLLDGQFDRGRYSTDASIYQIMPEAVVLLKQKRIYKKPFNFLKTTVSQFCQGVVELHRMGRP